MTCMDMSMMFFEKIFGRLRRTHPGAASPDTTARATTTTATTTNRVFGRSNTRILDDGPSSLQEVSVRKLPLEDDDGDTNDWEAEEEPQPQPQQQPQQACPSSPGAPIKIKPRRVDGTRCVSCVLCVIFVFCGVVLRSSCKDSCSLFLFVFVSSMCRLEEWDHA